uniref:Myb-like domain-containing protein n=1 Tax=Branchiostoma floridae TaxID=7739 RepID=C3Y1N7_BRAFL|eukprot:XP_002609767.1 hypothetical protein BRAFLDRAFT_78599 [Branchiostoma floridae]
MSSTELKKTEEDATLLPTDTVEELGRPEVTTQESPTDDGEDVHDKPGQEKTESVDVVEAQTFTSSDNNEELEPSSQPLQSVVNRSTAGSTATTDTNRTVVSTAKGGENVSEKCRGYSTLDDLVEDSRDGFGMQIVETSPGQGKNKKKAGRKRKKGEKSLKPRKLRLILPHPEGAEGEGSNAGFLDPSFESHLEDIGRNYSLSTTNVKSILHRVITNESVVAMMRHSVKEDQGEEETEGDISTNNPLAELFEPKMTRARAKEVAEKGSFVVPWPISPVKKPAESQPAKFIDLSFEEDEDDDEYEPEDDENEESDIDSIASREASDFGSPMPSTPRQFLRTYSESDRKDDSEDTDDRQETAEQGGKVEPHIKIQPTPMGPPLPPLSKEKTDAAFLSELDTFDEELSELSGRTARSTMDFNTEENLGLIANRTRSKCPLKDTPIDILEAAFHAPDITQDMYDTECDDSEWQGWLKGLFKTDLDMSGDADDEQNDPDYNFLQEEEEVDTEDLRDDRAVRITKKEVNELMDELLQQYEEEMEQLGGDAAPGLDDSTTTDPLTPPPSRTFVKPPPISFDGPLSTVMAKTHKTVQQQLQDEKMRGKVPGGGRKVQSLPVLTQGERQQLQQQMQQHVQLLCQVHVLTREEPQLQEVAQVTKNFLKENQMFVQRSTQLHQMQVEQYSSAGAQVPQVNFHSMFDTCNLQGAVDIVDQNIPVRSFTASPMKKTAKGSKSHKAKPTASSQATIAESKVFMYPALLPTCALDLHDPLRHGKEKPCFLGAEDNLLALGMCQYQGMSTVEMLHYIRENMIPTKTCEQIRIRIKNLKANKKKTGNIVQVYSKTKQMPALPVVCPDMEAAQAVSPVHLQGKHLPGWLQDYQQTNQPKANSLLSTKMRNLSPKKTEKMSPTQRDILPKGFVPVMSVKKALFQSPSKPHSTVTTNSSTTSATVSTSTGTMENPAKTLQTLAPKSAEQNVRTEGECLQQPDIEHPERQGVFMVQSDSTERPCLDQPCTEQPRVPQGAEEITAHPSEEVPSDQAVTEDNPVVPVPEDVLVSSTEEQELMAKEVEAEQGPDLDNLSEEQSATSKRMVMKVKTFKKKAKGRRKQLQKDMASTLLLLDSDLMDRDPLREERETMMAKNFLERVRDSLREEEGKYHEVLQVFHQGHQEGRTIVQLYQELQRILARWPGLLGEFAAFLQPAEAVECDLFMEHQEYVQARSFLRKLEVFFSDNPDRYQKVLRVFASYMREGASLEGLRQEITPLLQGQPYLLQEFTRFFPDLPPPQSMMGDFEEIHMASDSDGDEVPDNFEEIVLPDEDDEEVSREKKQVDPWKLLLAQKHGTKECKCECHESSTDLRVQRRNRHCVACNTKLTPKDLQAKKDIILRHQALLHTRESPIPDRTGRKIPAKRRRKKTGSEMARDSPSLDTAMVEDSCSSPLNQGYDLAGSGNSSARPQKSSSHQMSVLAKFSPLGSGQEAGVGDEEGMRKLSANEEDAEESSQESDEELEQVTEEAVRNLRDLCEEIPAPDWQKSATIVESFRRRLQEIAQHEYDEEEEEEDEDDEDEDKLSSGDESQDAEFSDLEEASGSGSASPSSLQALSAATSPGAASQGSEESPKSHSTSGPSQQGLAASTSPGTASLSEESPRSHTKAGISQKGLADVLSPDTASQRSGGLPKVHITSGKSQLELSATISQGEGAAVRSPDVILQVSQDLPKAPTPTEQSKTAEPEAVASQVSKELPKISGRGPDIALQGTGESPGASITIEEGKTEGLETATEMAGTDIGNTSGVEIGQLNVSSQRDGAADQLRQDLGNNTVEVEDSRDSNDSRTLRGSMQDNAINQKGEKVTEDHHTTSSDSGRQSIPKEYSETHDHHEVGAASDRNVPSSLGGGTSDTVQEMTADSSQEIDKEENETDTLRHKEDVSTRSEGEDEKMEATEGQDQAEEKGSSGDGTILWTRDQDRTLLQACQQQGATAETFAVVAEQLGDRTPQQVTDRFMELMALYHQQGTSTDEETGTDGETEEEEGSEYSTEQDPGDVEDD